MVDKNKCTFCSEFEGAEFGNAYRDYCRKTDYESRLICQTENLIALPSIGQLVEGYTLICTRQHYLSMGSFLDSGNYHAELAEFVKHVRLMLGELYSCGTIVFEHGPGRCSSNLGCGTDHAHLHIVPCSIDMKDLLLECDFKWESSTNFDKQSDLAKREKDYIYYENDGGESIVCEPPKNLPSQFFRRILADALNIKDSWDWKDYPYTDRIESYLSRCIASKYVVSAECYVSIERE